MLSTKRCNKILMFRERMQFVCKECALAAYPAEDYSSLCNYENCKECYPSLSGENITKALNDYIQAGEALLAEYQAGRVPEFALTDAYRRLRDRLVALTAV